jgi:hypothetical protein
MSRKLHAKRIIAKGCKSAFSGGLRAKLAGLVLGALVPRFLSKGAPRRWQRYIEAKQTSLGSD